MLIRVLILLCLATPAFAQQQAPEPEPKFELPVCEGQAIFYFRESRKGWSMANQYAAQAADLQKKLAEAEAKVPPYPIDPNTLSE